MATWEHKYWTKTICHKYHLGTQFQIMDTILEGVDIKHFTYTEQHVLSSMK